MTKKLLVSESDFGVDTDKRIDDIRGVQTPAHPHFEDSNIHLLTSEALKGYGSHHLEKAGMPRQLPPLNKAVGHAIHFAMYRCEIVVADFLSVYPNALVDAHQVW